MTEENTNLEGKVGNLALGTRPELEANMRQNWELISFVSQPGKPNNYSAVSTAAVFPPVPFETFIPALAERVPSELNVDGMETFIFDHGHDDDRPKSHRGKTEMMGLGVLDHFSLIIQTLYNLQSHPQDLSEIISKEPPDTFRILTFIYKPKQNGWIVVETRRDNGETRTYVYPRANKADPNKEVRKQETLYFDSKKRQEVKDRGGLKTHFGTTIFEVESNLGYFSRFQPVSFDREKLKELIGLNRN